MSRADGRSDDQLRAIKFTRNWLNNAEGSVLVEFGNTRVLCVASFTPGVPRWLVGKGEGWVTSEYAMLPRATHTRSDRESVKGKLGGRTQEISRLVGRSLRGIVDMKALGENTIVIDCDVLQADGGTRTAAITGAYVALADAISWAQGKGHIAQGAKPLSQSVAAVSVGIVNGKPTLDLCYEEDVSAETDMNIVCTGDGNFIEVQGTAEGAPFDRSLLNQLLDLGAAGCAQLTENAKLKAKSISIFTKLPCLADDSGLFIDALAGDPGIYSARWAGYEGVDAQERDRLNIEKVLTQLKDVPVQKRGAQFKAVVAFYKPSTDALAIEKEELGVMPGEIVLAPLGDGGFGYDPIFKPTGFDQTLAQLPPGVKDEVSHRGIAFRAMTPFLLSNL